MKNEGMFKCELIDNSIIKERFFRYGESAGAVRDGLEIFEFGAGEWRITEVDEN